MSDPTSPSPRAREIVGAARELLEKEGPEAVSMRRIADRIGIRAPSLYKHFPDKSAVEAALTAAGMAELAEALEIAEASGDGDPIAALLAAYRAYALAHPHLYRLMSGQPLDRDALPAGLEDRAAAPLMRAVGGDHDTARALWGFAHGMVVLELAGRFPPGADLSGAWASGHSAFSA
ncbi:TetR/AcrR family transcriptional regulator [Streptomyces sp. SID3343]|uniref:TetR/AcrR family transcriptional regulator n=1 Tax=Streptomyces sp. SID3343 TaxID=2690260 RepID=UPI00136C206F|nr:TetR/AcrR family transcriptional regulator [Streptomyces sp. SID3343]MYV99463.1 TetR family transcriptional regulator [Streptomyces sp. SID3343]